jgi:hypothetical protein
MSASADRTEPVHVTLDAIRFKDSTSAIAYLPGLDPSEERPETPGHTPETTLRTGWWVKRSAKQVTDAAGQPVGFRHQLMHGRVVVRTGVGADYARTLSRQADFLNALGTQALHQVTASSSEGPDTSASSLHK